MEDYKIYWNEMYGVPQNIPEFAKEQRKRYMNQKWTDENRIKRLQELRSTILLRRAEHLPTLIRKKYFLIDNEEFQFQRNNIEPEFRFTLWIKPFGSIKHIPICYNIIDLYELANTGSKDHYENEIWKDPIYNILLSKNDVKRIKRVYDRCFPGKPSKDIWRQNLEEQEALFQENKNKIENKIENGLFGCINLKDNQAYQLFIKNDFFSLEEGNKKYGFDFHIFQEQLVTQDFFTNPLTGCLLTKSKQDELFTLLYP